jgi:hypothetical protein
LDVTRHWIGLAILFLLEPAYAQEPRLTNQPAVIRSASGTLQCRVVADGTPCGTDTFLMTVQSDATRTLRARAELPDRGMQIDIVLRVDRNFRPINAFSQTYSEGAFLGAGFWAVEGGTLTAMVKTPERLAEEKIPVPANFSMLLHPVAADGWHFGYYDKAKGGKQTSNRCAVGAARESIRCALAPATLEFVADETIRVPAGTFKTEHYKFGESTDVWLTGADKLVVQHEYRTFGIRYQLTELRQVP